MTQTPIPYLFLRGGTSRGPYFRREDLPQDRDALSRILIAVVGAGHPLNIDGIGGGNAVTTKVAMLSRSQSDDADVDYFFAQVSVDEPLVDYKPTCGNILVGVGPAAIEMGLVPVSGDQTRVRIRAVNTGALVEAIVETPGGRVRYDGDVAIAGVPGTAAPVGLNFLDVVGTSCGALLPTGNLRDTIDGIDVTCMDVAMPMAIARAEDFGLTGYESAAELDANRDFFARMEKIRIEAGRLMGMGDVTKSVTPKFGILARPRNGGAISARYFMPWNTHPSLAVTGSQCLAACALTPGTVADGLGDLPEGTPALMRIEHPMGDIEVTVDHETTAEGGFQLRSAGLVRTARLIARGEVMVPEAAMTGTVVPEAAPVGQDA
ncbi:4-oxalomesaconate tautomerase [Paracoccus sp. TK19116]|uniref:4-oxalomesaconate tautomerase n=1 Tax=Paracoccus albicereus TaxID=2922394 RepID=A0ABT1MPX5_9RHOB|nr:4-oxalomesaconate tautomerase [Paracoccus albicereus]MCQ0970355.1 4-oxalomesaconate tautomerase [Paracoccus albicereus]